VFWQVGGAVTIGTGASFQGEILGKTSISMKTGATLSGRLLAQTGVTLQKNAITRK
jgi:cytoskeletal protein CcmA (bactofilin family)